VTQALTHDPPQRGPCGHRAYGLACADYDRLLNHAKGLCQTCNADPALTGHGFLVVDHDDEVGRWAVRGLLCQDCNSSLPFGSSPGWATEYLARPWWRSEAHRLGVSTEAADEPPIASTVVAYGLNFRRDETGWRHVADFGGPSRTWAELNRRYAPYVIEVLDLPAVGNVSELPRQQRRAYVVAALRGGMTSSEAARLSGYTYATVRKMARENGIEPDERYRDRAERLKKAQEPSDG
jgi:hypothetical protein